MDVVLAWPAAFVAVTRTSSRWPLSAFTSLYETPVALAMPLHDVPADQQRSHRYVNFGTRDQLPCEAVSFFPTFAVPEIVGGLMFAGAAGTQ